MKHITVFKWLSVMLVLLIVSAAIGCGKKEAEKATPTPTATPAPTATPSEPSGETGSLSGVTGDVQVLRSWGSSWIAAASGMKIGTGDSLKTGSNGYALITFFDGSVMEVDSDSEISVEELQASGGSTTVRISQVLGNTLNRVQNLVDSSSTYEVETPAGSAVVRGTIYRVEVDQYGEVTRTCCGTLDEGDSTQHSVAFSGGGSTVNVLEHQMSCGWEGGTPGQPFYSDSSDDPLDSSTMDGGGGSPCPPGCYLIQDGFIQGEGEYGLFGAYAIDVMEKCYCPQTECEETCGIDGQPGVCCSQGYGCVQTEGWECLALCGQTEGWCPDQGHCMPPATPGGYFECVGE